MYSYIHRCMYFRKQASEHKCVYIHINVISLSMCIHKYVCTGYPPRQKKNFSPSRRHYLKNFLCRKPRPQWSYTGFDCCSSFTTYARKFSLEILTGNYFSKNLGRALEVSAVRRSIPPLNNLLASCCFLLSFFSMLSA